MPEQRFCFGFARKGSHEDTRRNAVQVMATIAYGKGVIALKQYHDRINAESFHHLFVIILQACLKKELNQGENFFCRMVTLHRTVLEPDLLEMMLVLKNLPFQPEVQI